MQRLVIALVLGRAPRARAAAVPPPREFEIVGQIQAVAPERGEVTVKHQDIKGFMPGMTMAVQGRSGRAWRQAARRSGDRHAGGRRGRGVHLEAGGHGPPRTGSGGAAAQRRLRHHPAGRRREGRGARRSGRADAPLLQLARSSAGAHVRLYAVPAAPVLSADEPALPHRPGHPGRDARRWPTCGC